ncbi:MAG: helix-turn-helix domain-containing protein [Sphingobium sp.]
MKPMTMEQALERSVGSRVTLAPASVYEQIAARRRTNILAMAAAGYSTRQIAHAVDCDASTVRKVLREAGA